MRKTNQFKILALKNFCLVTERSRSAAFCLLFSHAQCPMPNTSASLRDATRSLLPRRGRLSTSAPCPMPHAPCPKSKISNPKFFYQDTIRSDKSC
ncbi:hypothetical protein H6G98_18735 [Nostoc sp. FACHB-857]|nr:hypothetical protein [Nostoc sp. FACHB-857]